MIPRVGDTNDVVTLEVAGQVIANAESYEVNTSVFEQPASFSMAIGTQNNAADELRKVPPRTPFVIKINGAKQQTGWVGSPGTDGSGDSGTLIVVNGRDMMAPIHDMFIASEKSFQDASYLALAGAIKDLAGVPGLVISTSNGKNRNMMTGTKVHTYKEPETVQEILEDAGQDGVVYRTITAKLGERGYHFLKRYLDRVGLFFWCTGDGNFILSEPNAHQKPTWKIVRRRGQTSDETAILGHSYRNNSDPPRYSECRVYTRGGGRLKGRGVLKGLFEDQEMIDWGFQRPLVVRDVKGTTASQAAFLARRKLAEGRRSAWHFAYTMAGHSFPTVVNGQPTGPRAVWAPDTLVSVHDEEIGIFGDFYLGDVSHSFSSGTTSKIKLMRPGDLFYGSDE